MRKYFVNPKVLYKQKPLGKMKRNAQKVTNGKKIFSRAPSKGFTKDSIIEKNYASHNWFPFIFGLGVQIQTESPAGSMMIFNPLTSRKPVLVLI